MTASSAPAVDAQLRRVAIALGTSVDDLLLHAPADGWARGGQFAGSPARAR